MKIPKVMATVPDYPDDYYPKSLWLSKDITNIERTIQAIELALDRYDNVEWLIPIQGHWRSPRSILKIIDWLRETGILDKHHYYAVANLCTTEEVEVIVKTLNIARRELGKKWIHSFGITLDSLPSAMHLIDSFDSTAWTKNCLLYTSPSPRDRG